MGTAFQATASSAVVALCAKAIIGATIAVLLLLIIANLVKKDAGLKKLIFIVLVAVITIASTILFVTALNATQGYTISLDGLGVII